MAGISVCVDVISCADEHDRHHVVIAIKAVESTVIYTAIILPDEVDAVGTCGEASLVSVSACVIAAIKQHPLAIIERILESQSVLCLFIPGTCGAGLKHSRRILPMDQVRAFEPSHYSL